MNDRDLYQDIKSDAEILEQVKNPEYAHKLYSALCNTVWQPIDIINVLKNETWSATWRAVGSIIADLRNEGDYIDWYCSGYEGYVHPIIEKKLNNLGWVCIEKDTYIGEEITERHWGNFPRIFCETLDREGDNT